MFESDIVVIFKQHSCLLGLLCWLLGDLLHHLLWGGFLWCGSLLGDLLWSLLDWGCNDKIKSVRSSTSNWFLFIDKFNFLNSRSRTQDEIIGPDFFQRQFVKMPLNFDDLYQRGAVSANQAKPMHCLPGHVPSWSLCFQVKVATR